MSKFYHLVFLCISVTTWVLTMTDSVFSMATTKEQPTLALICADIGQDDALCRAVADALVQAQPGRRVLQRAAATGDDDVTVELRVSTFTQTAITARLVRTVPGQGGAQKPGPEVSFDVMDARLTPAMLARYARDLVKASAPILTP